MIRLHLNVDMSGAHLLFSLLEKGVVVKTRTGCTLRDFLCGQLGLDHNYLDQRVQTLFLNARPVDDIDKAVVQDGSILALSAAMPGLLGATMRKGGRYATLRRDISQPDEECGICETSGRVTLKLFNMVAKEVGRGLLEGGVEVDGSDLQRIADRYPGQITRSIKKARMDDRDATPDMTLFSKLSKERLWLSIAIDG